MEERDYPRILPKPDLMPLTGGYRKTPVLQIGADMIGDTQLILREIERRAPEPTSARRNCGLADAFGWWAERSLFGTAVAASFAKVGSSLPQAFIEASSGREFNPHAMKVAEPRMLDAFRAQLHWLEISLSDGKPFLFGPHPSAADCSLYHMVWFVRVARPGEALASFPASSPGADLSGIHRSWRAHHGIHARRRSQSPREPRNLSADRFTPPNGATVGRPGESASHLMIPEDRVSGRIQLRCRSMKLRSADTRTFET